MSDSIVKLRLPWLQLRPADTYEELVNSLLQLYDAVEEIFGRVERRIAEEQTKLKGFDARIDRAGALARKVQGSNAATIVLSAARYPAEEKLPDYKRLFYDEEKLTASVQARSSHSTSPSPAPPIAPHLASRLAHANPFPPSLGVVVSGGTCAAAGTRRRAACADRGAARGAAGGSEAGDGRAARLPLRRLPLLGPC